MKVLHVAGGLPLKDRPYQQPFIKSQIDSLIREGLEIIIVEIRGYESSFNYLTAIGEIKKIMNKKDIQLIHAHYSYCGLATLLADTNTPKIISLMGGEILGTPNFNGRYTIRGKVDRFLSKVNY